MTYNFDPDKWYENQSRILAHKLETGEIDKITYRLELQDLDRRFEDMQQRLQGTYTLPDGQSGKG